MSIVKVREKKKVAVFKLHIPLQPISPCRAVTDFFLGCFLGVKEAAASSCIEGGTTLLNMQYQGSRVTETGVLGLGFRAQVLLPWFRAEVLICPHVHTVLIIFVNQGGLQKFTSSI